MDCEKTGKLIRSLRLERGLTQKNIADALGISNKAVSKWECGLGYPDLALWPELSVILGVNMGQLMEGEITRNRPDSGNISRVRFYVCPDCGTAQDSQYGNVLSCSSAKINELLEWIKAQPFYENTTIVLSGDHLTMDPDFMKELDEEYVRTVYNCIINAPVKPVKEKNRQFATFDMMPTTLAALGVQIEGDRLALGTNLFSDKLTLTEEYGFEMLDKELQKKSEFYNKEFLGMTSSRDPFSSKESE